VSRSARLISTKLIYPCVKRDRERNQIGAGKAGQGEGATTSGSDGGYWGNIGVLSPDSRPSRASDSEYVLLMTPHFLIEVPTDECGLEHMEDCGRTSDSKCYASLDHDLQPASSV
jgi:hypothetical protein